MLVAALLLSAFSRLGSWVVVADPLVKADAIVVFGGQLPFRAMEAAAIYHEGWAPEVWVTRSDSLEGRASERLEIDHVPEHGYSRRVLEKLGVPPGAIRVLEPAVLNTTDEVRVAIKNLRAIKGRRAILVTSRYHTRRVKVTWEALADPEQEAVVRYTGDDPYNAERWWYNSRDALAVTREVGGILNAWGGFPLDTARE